jgi:WD40 repeat protein/predicted Ser/Thr protein kinase
MRFCSKCRAIIPPDAPQQSCIACLLESGLGSPESDIDASTELKEGVASQTRTVDRRFTPILSEFGDYELLEEIGRGGQGVVFRARQKSLNRIVALKVIALGHWATEEHLKRFRLEAEAAASLDHPRIVPIYEIGEREGSCYFSMKFVEGGQLDQIVRREPISNRQAAELLVKLARTIQYAHQRGILHRDLKPGNILLDKDGEPHLTDFGLARLVEKESTVTRTLQVLGTPSYMAPEQAAGRNQQLTTGADVYGLGAVCYQLLTGAPPFAGGTSYETIKMVLESPPRRPSFSNPSVSRDLEIICLKCLEKEPARRYSSAKSLADDLERFLRNEPIVSRPVSHPERVWRWCKRKPLIASLTTALVLSMIIGFAGVAWQLRHARQEEVIARRNLYSADMNLAHEAWEEGNLQRAQTLLRRHLPERGREDLRGFEWRYLWQLCRDESRSTFRNANFTPRESDGPTSRHLVLMPDDQTIVTASGSRLRWINVQNQQEVKTLNTGVAIHTIATASNRPDLLAYYSDKVHCISASGETLLGGGVAHDSCSAIALSPDGTLLAATGVSRFSAVPVRLWDVKTGRQLAEYQPNRIGATSLVFSPDGKYLVCGADDTTIQVLDGSNLQLVKSTEAQGGWVNALAFDHAGGRLASGSNNAQIAVWSFPEMREIMRLAGHHGRVGDLTFAPDRDILVSGGGDQTLRVWDLNRPGGHRILRGHRGGVTAVSFSSDGKYLYSGSYDDTIKLWPVGFGESSDVLYQPRFLYSIAFSPDGKVLAASDYLGHTAALFDVAGRRRWEQSIGKHSEVVQRVAFSPDGRFLATAGGDNEVQLWNLAQNKIAFFIPKTRHIFGMAFHPSQPLLVVAEGKVRFWNTETGIEVKSPVEPPANDAVRVAFSPDGKWIAFGMTDGTVSLHNLLSGEAPRLFHEHSSHVAEVCFSRDSTLLASGERNNRIAVYDVRQQRALKCFEAHTDWIWGLAFAPDGKTLVSTSYDGTIKFWRVADQQLTLTLRHDAAPVLGLAFSPSSDLMATCGFDRTLRFWPAPSLAEIDAAEKRAPLR